MRIWFNKTYSSIHSVLQNLRQQVTESPITLIYSHTHCQTPAVRVADEIYLEPTDLSTADYLEWALQFCKDKNIEIFWPGKAAILITQNLDRFLAQGTKVICVAKPDILKLLNNKALFYQDLDPKIAVPPDAIQVNSLDEFDSAYSALRKKHDKLCIKPSTSVFGLGFRVIDEHLNSITHLLQGIEYQIPLNELRYGMKLAPRFDNLVLMEYLPGHEWSVDCAASNGTLWCAVQRKKPLIAGYAQLIDNHPEIAGMVARLTKHFALNGLFNIQFKESIQGPKILEINARPSGGIGMAFLSGANLAKIALQGFQNQHPPAELEALSIAYGQKVAEINTAYIVENV